MNRQEKICIIAMHHVSNLSAKGLLIWHGELTKKGRKQYAKIMAQGFTCSQDEINEVVGVMMDEGMVKVGSSSQPWN